MVQEHVRIHVNSTRDAAVRKASKAVLRSLKARMGEDEDFGVNDAGAHKWLEQTRAAARRKGTHTNTSGVGGPNGKGGPRKYCPTPAELAALAHCRGFRMRVFLVDLSSFVVTVGPEDTVQDLETKVAKDLGVGGLGRSGGSNRAFSLYEMRSPHGTGKDPLRAIEHSLGEHQDEKVGELVAHWQHIYDNDSTRNAKSKKAKDKPMERWLLYKATLFMPIKHEAIGRCPTTLNLLYLQCFFDVTNGRYRVGMQVAITLGSLLLQGHFGDFNPEKAAELLPLCGGEEETAAAVQLCKVYLPRGISTLLERSASKQRRKTQKREKKGGGGGEGKGGNGGDDGGDGGDSGAGGDRSRSIPKAVQVAVSVLGAWSKLASGGLAPGEVKIRYVVVVVVVVVGGSCGGGMNGRSEWTNRRILNWFRLSPRLIPPSPPLPRPHIHTYTLFIVFP